jgi:hypothetical protein
MRSLVPTMRSRLFRQAPQELNAATVTAVGIWGATATRGLAPRPRGPAARRLEQTVTIATVIQLAASAALPAIAAAGRPDLTITTVAVTRNRPWRCSPRGSKTRLTSTRSETTWPVSCRRPWNPPTYRCGSLHVTRVSSRLTNRAIAA